MRQLVLVLLLGIGLMVVPFERAAACDCQLIELADAVRQADVAFVGSLDARVPGGDNFGFPVLDEWRWHTESSRDAGLPADVTIMAAADDGANCGVPFGVGERWLVIAFAENGVLQTTGCQPNHRMDGSAPDNETLIAELVPYDVGPAESGGRDLPLPILPVLGAAALIGGIGLVAFRRNG